MILHCTKKLYAKLSGDTNYSVRTMPAIGIQPKWLNWHANLITVQRRQCLIAVHDATRFALFIPCLTKKDFDKLDWHFNDVFINTLLKSEIPFELADIAANHYQSLNFDTVCDRSVQGAMNQMAQETEFSVQFKIESIADINPYRFSAWLCNRPCTVKGQKDCIWPDKAMGELLAIMGKQTETTLLH